MGNGYSLTNSGGVEVNCPYCAGVGSVKTIESALQEVTKKVEKHKHIKEKTLEL